MHKGMGQSSEGFFPCSPPIYYCDSMSCGDRRGCSPQGCLIHEAGSSPQHTPSSLPTTFTFHCRDAAWNNNNTCTTSHCTIGAVNSWLASHPVTSLRIAWLSLENAPRMPVWTRLVLRTQIWCLCVGKGHMMHIRRIYHSAMGFGFHF